MSARRKEESDAITENEAFFSSCKEDEAATPREDEASKPSYTVPAFADCWMTSWKNMANRAIVMSIRRYWRTPTQYVRS
jgi:hypothetical protein